MAQETSGPPQDDGTIEGQAQASAEGSTSEDTLGAYKALFDMQKEQIDSLLKTNQSLQSQIGVLIRNGASPHGSGLDNGNRLPGNGDTSNDDPGMGVEHQEPYVSLADLGSEIGKRDYHSHNATQD